MEPTPDNIQSLLDENAQLRERLASLAKDAREGIEYEREWQVAQQDKMRWNYEKEIRDLRNTARAREESAWHREDLLSMKRANGSDMW